MKQINTKGIILSRTNFGEADRIITILTPDNGKVRLIAKGVRKIKSKLAGGIELFAVSQITYIKGRGEIGTLISTRLIHYYGFISSNLERTMAGYDFIKQLNRATEEMSETGYFNVLEASFAALDNQNISLNLIQNWFAIQLLRLSGQTPHTDKDSAGLNFSKDTNYTFSFDSMSFTPHAAGPFNIGHIKVLHLSLGNNSPRALQRITGIEDLSRDITPLIQTMFRTYIRL
ncbi:MAG: DNA repair protein RecO [Candidatus Saccharimonadales bacterium]|jgi:DNA repair protein RecO (recombination protein O)